MTKIAISCGDPNGIGPEIILKSASKLAGRNRRFIIFGPRGAFVSLMKKIEFKSSPIIVRNAREAAQSKANIILVDSGYCKITYGKSTKSSGKMSYTAIREAFNFVVEGSADAIVTAPISKEAIKLAGVNYPGHTEMLADWCKAKEYLMMFYSAKLIAALATIHKPIAKVAASINQSLLQKKLKVALNSLKFDFGIPEPKIAVLGLNPHAGESGFIGTEEKKKIMPAIKHGRNQNIRGAFVPDAFFGNHLYKDFDLVFGMYHDQVLIPFKMMNFNKGVNFTAGLPIVRTSPDHGTAFDIAGRGIADPESMIEAVKLSEKIVKNRTYAAG